MPWPFTSLFNTEKHVRRKGRHSLLFTVDRGEPRFASRLATVPCAHLSNPGASERQHVYVAIYATEGIHTGCQKVFNSEVALWGMSVS
ncbi:hypothetical protein M378DRAFT_165169, partial [Amanita muscaria Koide BX008]